MNYKCKGCGGSIVFSPKHKTMFCPHCGQTDTEKIIGNESMTSCPFCGAELDAGEFESSSQCPYCENYIIYDKRVTGDYQPDCVIPFAIDKEDAIAEIEKAFAKRTFIPGTFWDEKRLKGMKGHYVPFFLYDFDTKSNYAGEGTKTRVWSQGNYRYTETSYFNIQRKMSASYENVPADASARMPDETMDMLEPYHYEDLKEFDPKYMSGFFGEVYNDVSDTYEKHASSKALESATTLLGNSIAGYTLKTPVNQDATSVVKKDVKYALFPVWRYDFEWNGTPYPVYINGQTKKVVGVTPVSRKKVFYYALTHGIMIAALLEMLLTIFEAM